jgi:tetratricopeptide (TPR) repeat protein
MLKDVSVTCPKCNETTTLAVASPDPGMPHEKKISSTSCRQCRADLLTATRGDGSVEVYTLDADASDPGSFELVEVIESVFELPEIVRVPFALWQPRGVTIDDFEHRPAIAEALETALERAQSEPRPLSVPRRIFISYRWGDADEDAWVEALDRELRRRGNSVVFDRRTQREAHPPSVPELVARIAGCHVFLAVLDPGYVERVASGPDAPQQEGWVTDEFHTALAFAGGGVLSILGLLRQGDLIPTPFRMFAVGEAGNTFDVRGDDELGRVLDQYFVQFGTAPDEDVSREAAAALHASRTSALGGDRAASLAHADEACRLLPDLADGFAQRARIAYELEQHEQALGDAQRALDINPLMDEMLIHAAAAANDLGRFPDGARYARMALERNRAQANAHYLAGSALSRMDQVDAALAHFNIARRADLGLLRLYNEAGYAWRRIGEPAVGLQWYREGLRRAPGHPGFLVNATAAAMEAGQPMPAYELLSSLLELHPGVPEVDELAKILADWVGSDSPPPVLSPRLPRPTPVQTVECSACEARVPLADEDQMLCAGCGGSAPPLEPCAWCSATGKVTLPLLNVMDAGISCPFCGVGSLSFVQDA